VHEDLKPENILLRDERTLCLGDFGLASFPQKNSRHHGSPLYNPPEVKNSFDQLPADYDWAKADVWGVGLIALEMLGVTIPGNRVLSGNEIAYLQCFIVVEAPLKELNKINYVPEYVKEVSRIYNKITSSNYRLDMIGYRISFTIRLQEKKYGARCITEVGSNTIYARPWGSTASIQRRCVQEYTLYNER